MNIITVRQGDKYGPEYVTMLSRMVAEHSDHVLLVLGDGDDATVPLTQGYKGWHAKLELFRPDLEPLRPFLYFDLDTYILGDIRHFPTDPEGLVLIRDFNRKDRGNSGVMCIPSDTDEIWAKRTTEVADGDYLHQFSRTYMQDVFPGAICSYKKHCKDGPHGKVICFHGQPKPHNVDGWAGEVWRKYTDDSWQLDPPRDSA